ncbi:hypothetical protein BaRGS_00020646 [Batillaria attramentaria]|uniref:Uncharacterized protein n=1 Tax=Batillaria attramentaria TaxID=370345 RepID=A0ABD0KLI6_9CAEN
MTFERSWTIDTNPAAQCRWRQRAQHVTPLATAYAKLSDSDQFPFADQFASALQSLDGFVDKTDLSSAVTGQIGHRDRTNRSPLAEFENDRHEAWLMSFQVKHPM